MKWVYIEDRCGRMLAKEYIDPKQAFDILKANGWLVSTKIENVGFIVYRIYR